MDLETGIISVIHLSVVTLYVMQENKKCVFILFIMCLFYFKLHILYEKLFSLQVLARLILLY